MKKVIISFSLAILISLISSGCSSQLFYGVSRLSGPPAHAKAYGYNKKHIFRYYQDIETYWDSESNMYFVLDGNRWIAQKTIPNINISYSYITIEADTPEPWLNHAAYKMKYPPQNNKNKKK